MGSAWKALPITTEPCRARARRGSGRAWLFFYCGTRDGASSQSTDRRHTQRARRLSATPWPCLALSQHQMFGEASVLRSGSSSAPQIANHSCRHGPTLARLGFASAKGVSSIHAGPPFVSPLPKKTSHQGASFGLVDLGKAKSLFRCSDCYSRRCCERLGIAPGLPRWWHGIRTTATPPTHIFPNTKDKDLPCTL